MDFSYTLFIPLILFANFLILGLAGSKLKAKASGLLGTAGIFATAVLSYLTAYNYFFAHGGHEGFLPETIFSMTWLRFTPALSIDMTVVLDPISVMMLVVITTVSSMVHLYSLSYMHGEKGFERYYAFLSLFSFSMICLVISGNIFQMYMFWELVGVSSFLLIGFYYTKPSAVAASKKAFIVTRFADLGFLIGILLLGSIAGSFDFATIIKLLSDSTSPLVHSAQSWTILGVPALTLALLLVFMGGAGKSAMFPLHVWLPDAMEGPTPVSALIHAATMVVSGVFLVARLFPVFANSAPDALEIIAYIGAFSSLFAAIIACTQIDIKRVLAYSTISQIAYMIFSLGVSGYGEHGLGYMASMFHLFTHAMFKALLFLGAGSVIHAVHSNNMTDMGGLRKYMPITNITFFIACLAIAGIPPFAGFFSKDEILVAAFEHNKFLFAIQFAVAGLTAFYMFRLYFRVFWNKEPHYHHAPHESPLAMTIPLMFLGVASIFGGFVPFHTLVTSDGKHLETHFHPEVAIPAILLALIGISIAFALYKNSSEKPESISKSLGGLYKAAFNKFYIDEVYLFITKSVIFGLISRPIAWFDKHVIDATMDLFSTITNWISEKIKRFQSGFAQQYAFYFFAGVLLFGLTFLYLAK